MTINKAQEQTLDYVKISFDYSILSSVPFEHVLKDLNHYWKLITEILNSLVILILCWARAGTCYTF